MDIIEERSKNEKLQSTVQTLEAQKKKAIAEDSAQSRLNQKQRAEDSAAYNRLQAENANSRSNSETEKRIAAEKKREQTDRLNTRITYQAIALGFLFIAFLILSIIVILRARKDRKISKITKIVLHQKLLLKESMTHDIKRLVLSLPDALKDWADSQKTKDSAFSKLVTHSENIGHYVLSFFDTGKDETITSISKEIEKAKLYVETYKVTTLPDDYIISIINEINDPYVLNDLPVPAHLLNNFIKNSVEHGSADDQQSEITIRLRSTIIPKGYQIIVEDDGCGINFAKRTGGTSTGLGLQLVNDAITAYNLTNREFKISFPKASIFDKEDKNMGRGTIVILEFLKK